MTNLGCNRPIKDNNDLGATLILTATCRHGSYIAVPILLNTILKRWIPDQNNLCNFGLYWTSLSSQFLYIRLPDRSGSRRIDHHSIAFPISATHICGDHFVLLYDAFCHWLRPYTEWSLHMWAAENYLHHIHQQYCRASFGGSFCRASWGSAHTYLVLVVDQFISCGMISFKKNGSLMVQRIIRNRIYKNAV